MLHAWHLPGSLSKDSLRKIELAPRGLALRTLIADGRHAIAVTLM
jgi:hypothetical protein